MQAAAANNESSAKRSKSGDENASEKDTTKAKAETKGNDKDGGEDNGKQNKDNSKPPEPPKDYIHVRARRGQATDAHSLAERVWIKIKFHPFFSSFFTVRSKQTDHVAGAQRENQ